MGGCMPKDSPDITVCDDNDNNQFICINYQTVDKFEEKMNKSPEKISKA